MQWNAMDGLEDDIEKALDDDTLRHGDMCIGLRHLTSGLLLASVPAEMVLRVSSRRLEACLLRYTLTPPREIAPGLRWLRIVTDHHAVYTVDHTRWIICFQRKWRQRQRLRMAWFARRLHLRECTGHFPTR